MINQMSKKENPKIIFLCSQKLQIGKLLLKASIVKFCGISAYEFPIPPAVSISGEDPFLVS
jgi:hypothetical protein